MKYEVEVTIVATERTYHEVEAASEDEAIEKAKALRDDEGHWDWERVLFDDTDATVVSAPDTHDELFDQYRDDKATAEADRPQ